MSAPRSPRLVMMAGQFPKLSETFLVRKFVGLLESGWDVHVLRQSGGEDDGHFPELENQLRGEARVHDPWPHRPRLEAALSVPLALLVCLARNPRGTTRYLRACLSEGLGLCQSLRAFYLDARLIELKPDIVHFEFGSFASSRMHLKRRLGCRTTVSFRGFDLNFVPLDDSDSLTEVFDQADSLHLLGQSLLETARELGCREDCRTVLIPPAVDLDYFSPLESSLATSPLTGSKRPGREEPLRILSVGRLTWKKGYDYALLAVRQLLDEGVQCEYHIVGDGDYLTALGFARFDLGLENHVVFCGALSPAQTREQLRAADIFLHPAVTEGFCNAVIEAQATGLPVVCSDAGGLTENIEHGVTGYAVPRRDPKALCEVLRHLASDRTLRQRLGAAGRERALRRFCIEDQIRAFDCFYHSALEITA